jgi:hypothetical protein
MNHKAGPSLRIWQLLNWSEISRLFLTWRRHGGYFPSYKEPDVSLPCSQDPTFGPYPKIYDCTQEPHLTFLRPSFSINHPSTPRSNKSLLPSGFLQVIVHCISGPLLSTLFLFLLLFRDSIAPIGWWMNMEHMMEWELAQEIKGLRESLPQCHFVYHESPMTWLGIEPGPPLWEAED